MKKLLLIALTFSFLGLLANQSEENYGEMLQKRLDPIAAKIAKIQESKDFEDKVRKCYLANEYLMVDGLLADPFGHLSCEQYVINEEIRHFGYDISSNDYAKVFYINNIMAINMMTEMQQPSQK